jgi:hypothetical protein
VRETTKAPDMSVAHQAAEHVRRLLNRPGLRQVVQMAQTIKSSDRKHGPPAPAGQNAAWPSATGSGCTPTP